VAIAEICIASGVGADITTDHPFSEDPHRFLAVAQPGSIRPIDGTARRIGTIGGDVVTINRQSVSLAECAERWHDAIPNALAG
jgi:hypothetical protein